MIIHDLVRKTDHPIDLSFCVRNVPKHDDLEEYLQRYLKMSVFQKNMLFRLGDIPKVIENSPKIFGSNLKVFGSNLNTVYRRTAKSLIFMTSTMVDLSKTTAFMTSYAGGLPKTTVFMTSYADGLPKVQFL